MDDHDEFCLLSSSKVEEQKTTLGSFLEEASIYRYMDFYLISDRYPKNLTSPTRFCTKHNKIGSYKSYYNLNITSCNINFTFKLFYIFSSRCLVVGLKMEKYFNKIKIHICTYISILCLAYDAKKSYVFLAHHVVSS